MAVALFAQTQIFAQNVGIGEPNPSSKLSVKGNMSIGSTFSNVAAPAGGMIVEGTLGLGTSTPDLNTILDMGSAGKGVVMPKLTRAQRLALPNPTKGLLVFDADSNTLFFHNGTSWLNFPAIDQVNNIITNISGSNGSSLLGGLLGSGTPGPTGPRGEGYGSTSSSLLTISTGTKIVTTQTGDAWQVDDRVRISNSGSNYMEGVVTAYTSGLLTVNVTRVVGSGIYSSWRVSLAGDPGATGPTGPTGPAGTAGTNGTNGTNGATGPTGATGAAGAAGTNGTNGSLWYAGSGVPSSATGAVNDFYINTANGAYYKKTGATTWTQQGSLMGATGATGAAGTNGTNGAAGVTGPTGATGAAGTNGAVGATGPTGPTGVAGAVGAAGSNGTNGATWLSGAVAPTGGQGVLNDFFLNSSNGTYYKKTTASVWTSQGSLKGATGATGANGTNGVTGATGPAGTNGTNGAVGATGPTGATGAAGIGINGATGPTGPAGTNGTNGVTGATGPTGAAGTNGAVGATGPTGAAGTNGTNGTNGATWLSGTVAPTSGQGVINDFYLNTTDGSYYKKTGATTWTSQGTLKGSTGATGATGAAGTNGTNGATGATGAAGTNGTNGATGPTGPTGAAGVGINGATGPTGPAGVTGPTGPTGAAATPGWGLTGNAGTTPGTNFIGTTDNKDLIFKTNGTEKARLQANGLLGIGCTTVPTNKWIVASSLAAPTFTSAANGFGSCFPGGAGFYVKNSDDGVEGKYESYTGKIHIGVASATPAPLVFYTEGSTESARLDENGNFGIGTAAPSQKLEVIDGNILISNTGTAGQLRFQEPSGSGSSYTAFKAQAQSASVTYTLPAADGSSGQFLSTNGSGTLSWAAASTNYINNGTSVQSSSNFNISGNGTIGGTADVNTLVVDANASVAGTTSMAGAVSMPITTTTSNLTLSSSHHTVIITGSSPTITFPAASGATGRIYVIVNQTGAARNTSTYKNFSASNTTTVPANSAIMVQSDGTNWYLIK